VPRVPVVVGIGGRATPMVPLTVEGSPRGTTRGPTPRDVVATLCAVPLYAAYGSNMDPAQMMQRAPHSPMSGTGWLEGWRLTFGGEDLGWEGALSTVVEDPDSRVFVVLYDVSPLDVDQLDRWEGGELGMHKKLRLRIQTMDGPQLAWVYVLDAYEGGLPSARYIGVLSDAAESAGAPDDYVRALRERPCRSVGPGTITDLE
jgi:gamma-glutamylcyclotransferase (GGCT)/AIG2-like uncharacterized protein YtfP